MVHPDQLEYHCQDCPQLPFCPSVTSKPIPDECLCNSASHPPRQCLMTFHFGQAKGGGPRYTSCDIQTMNFYESKASCHRKVKASARGYALCSYHCLLQWEINAKRILFIDIHWHWYTCILWGVVLRFSATCCNRLLFNKGQSRCSDLVFRNVLCLRLTELSLELRDNPQNSYRPSAVCLQFRSLVLAISKSDVHTFVRPRGNTRRDWSMWKCLR